MNYFKKSVNFVINNYYFLFVLSFIIWIICFRTFLFGQSGFTSDAQSYYEHIRYFICNIIHGVYPFWDHVWESGAPNEFFLRRFGSFNPLFLLIGLFKILGISYRQSYLIFLALYYFIGMIGFYLVAFRIFNDRLTAFTAYLLLMFSSLATRLFDSYIVYEFVPMVWFFYFFIAFLQDFKKHFFVGSIFTILIILTTYIPFYFIIIFFIVSICFFGFYFYCLQHIFSSLYKFIKNNKLLIFTSIIVLLLFLLPGLLMVKSCTGSEILLQSRHAASDSSNQMEVGYKTITNWGVLEDIFYSTSFPDFRRFKFAILYVPLFSYILFALGIFTHINRKSVFLFSSAFLIFLVSSHHFPIYEFLYKNIFFFKYFRNLHFFLWLGMMPIFILFLAGQLKYIMEKIKFQNERILWNFVISSVHLVFLLFLIFQKKSGLISSYIGVLASLCFFLFYDHSKLKNNKILFLIILFIVTIQPLEVYHYLNINEKRPINLSIYDKPFLDFKFQSMDPIFINVNNKNTSSNFYYTTKYYNFLRSNIASGAYDKYVNDKLKLYGAVEFIDENNFDKYQIENSFMKNINIAFISDKNIFNNYLKVHKKQNPLSNYPLVINKNLKEIDVEKFNSNYLRIRSFLREPKFLVYNDNFEKGWKAFINGKEVTVVRSNISFKGIFIPEGINIIEFKYGSKLYKFFNYFLLLISYSIFGFLMFKFTKLLLDKFYYGKVLS